MPKVGDTVILAHPNLVPAYASGTTLKLTAFDRRRNCFEGRILSVPATAPRNAQYRVGRTVRGIYEYFLQPAPDAVAA